MARQLWLDLAPRGGAYQRENFVDGASNAEARAMLANWPHWPGGALALIGPQGSGKSHLASLWLDTAKTATGNNPRAVLIEDADRGMDEEKLFALLNRAVDGEVSILLTGRTHPRQWPAALADVRSRLAAINTVWLEEPDDEVLGGVLAKLFKDRMITPGERVIPYLLLRMERSTAAALDCVERIHAAAHQEGRNIHLPLVRKVMRDVWNDRDEPAQ